jgi:hypothetical protein
MFASLAIDDSAHFAPITAQSDCRDSARWNLFANNLEVRRWFVAANAAHIIPARQCQNLLRLQSLDRIDFVEAVKPLSGVGFRGK